MSSLILDSSTERGYVALQSAKKGLLSTQLPFGLQNSTHLIPEIKKLFIASEMYPQQLSYIAVGIGPGSYTGIRVAVSAAKGMAYACNLPLVGFCSLFGFVPSTDGPFAAVVDGKIGGVYMIKGSRRNGKVTYSSQPILQPIEGLERALEDVDTIITPYKKPLEGKITSSHLHIEEFAANVLHIQCVCEELYTQGRYSHDGRLDILYLRTHLHNYD